MAYLVLPGVGAAFHQVKEGIIHHRSERFNLVCRGSRLATYGPIDRVAYVVVIEPCAGTVNTTNLAPNTPAKGRAVM